MLARCVREAGLSTLLFLRCWRNSVLYGLCRRGLGVTSLMLGSAISTFLGEGWKARLVRSSATKERFRSASGAITAVAILAQVLLHGGHKRANNSKKLIHARQLRSREARDPTVQDGLAVCKRQGLVGSETSRASDTTTAPSDSSQVTEKQLTAVFARLVFARRRVDCARSCLLNGA
jgi:hypothetical protein